MEGLEEILVEHYEMEKTEVNKLPLLKYLTHIVKGKITKSTEKKKTNKTTKLDEFLDPQNTDFLYRNYQNLGDEEKQLMNCDEVFALYLYTVAQKVKHEFYD